MKKSLISVTLITVSFWLILLRVPLHIEIPYIGTIIVVIVSIILFIINRPLQPIKRLSLYGLPFLMLIVLSAAVSSVEVERIVFGLWHAMAPIVALFVGYQISLRRDKINRLIDLIAISFIFALALGTIISLIAEGYPNDIKDAIQLPSDGAWARNFALACLVPIFLSKALVRKSVVSTSIAVLLTLTLVILKARMPLLAVLLCWLLWVGKSRHLHVKLLTLGLAPIGIAAVLHLTDISESYNKLYMYFSSDSIENISRSALLYNSILISLDKFPFGSGLGTFASPIAAYKYSDLYYTYGLNTVHGLTPDAGVGGKENFLVDIYAAQVIAEFGMVGATLFMLVLSCFFYIKTPKRLMVNRSFDKSTDQVNLVYLMQGLLIILTLTSFTMPAMINPLFLSSIILLLGIISRSRVIN